MDRDTVRAREGHLRILSRFEAGEADPGGGGDAAGTMGALRAWAPYVLVGLLLMLGRIPELGLTAALRSVEVGWTEILGTSIGNSVQPLYNPGVVPFALVALAIPLHARFQARGYPVVGTNLDYFEFRGLDLAEGRLVGLLGECVIGAGVARKLGIGAGDSLITSPETVFDLAGVYPLKMRVTGVLAFSDSPDDHAIFVDVKTTWVIEGLARRSDRFTELAARWQAAAEGDDLEGLRRQQRQREGIPVAPGLYEELASLGQQYRVPFLN